MRDLNARLLRLENAIRPSQHRTVREFAIEGPVGLPEADAVAFLRECGHDVREEDHNLIRIVIGARDGRPVDLPLRDLTAECRSVAPALHMQRGHG